MKGWPLDEYCAKEYSDPGNRRFHAQPVACPACGPGYYLHPKRNDVVGSEASIRRASEMLRAGQILAIKGLGGYHLACDARNAAALAALRDRKFRKEKPFALMVRDLDAANSLVDLGPEAVALLTSSARPIVLGTARVTLIGVAPENGELGVMLPYTPLHHLLFAAGAPEVLVMTSANRSSEPIAYEDEDAIERLAGIADSFLVGQRPIARRVDDSVVRVGAFGPVVLRRARGFAPGAVAAVPGHQPILALGAELKNAVTLVVDGQAFVSQHIGDLDHYWARKAFEGTVADLISMYELPGNQVQFVKDSHPQTSFGSMSSLAERLRMGAVQHHRAHIASVLAERGEWTRKVVGVSFDGTGYGDDGTIWGGEIFVGSVQHGFVRVAHLRPASLAGGDAAARFPVQAAAGFLAQIENLPDVMSEPFHFPDRYHKALQLIDKGVRTFRTTSVGRLFDTAAALLGFTREITFEGQAAIWLEQLARGAPASEPYLFPFVDGELDFRPLLFGIAQDRIRGRNHEEIARAFQLGVAHGLHAAAMSVCQAHEVNTVVLSGGVFQNELLMQDLKVLFEAAATGGQAIRVWTNRAVPPNDGGISLGQAALAAFGQIEELSTNETTLGD
jgi:hydrogenase maturation protein HypF